MAGGLLGGILYIIMTLWGVTCSYKLINNRSRYIFFCTLFYSDVDLFIVFTFIHSITIVLGFFVICIFNLSIRIWKILEL